MSIRYLSLVLVAASFSVFISKTAQATSYSMRPGTRALAGEARKKEIARKVDVLANLGYGVTVHEAKGKTGEEMVRNLAVKMGALEPGVDEFLVNLPSKEFGFGDMMSWGTTDLSSALDLFSMGDGSEGDERKVEQRSKLGATIIKELHAMKAVSYGFTSGSSSYCGVTFMGLLIVDEENSLIYELALTDSGEC